MKWHASNPWLWQGKDKRKQQLEATEIHRGRTTARPEICQNNRRGLKISRFGHMNRRLSVAARHNQRIFMMPLPIFKRMMVVLAFALLQGCASVQQISQQSVEDKVAKIKLGVTTMSEVETVFGARQGGENQRWFYNLSDTAVQITERKTGLFSGAIPVAPASVATNTRALITVGFADDGKVAALEVTRFFDPPFNNDYWYRMKDGAQNVLNSVISAAEASDLRVWGSDKSAGMVALEDTTSNARIVVTLEAMTLHITSQNPHDRLTTEYRVFTKRERAFINKISTADFLW